jgi:hypothetical protein
MAKMDTTIFAFSVLPLVVALGLIVFGPNFRANGRYIVTNLNGWVVTFVYLLFATVFLLSAFGVLETWIPGSNRFSATYVFSAIALGVFYRRVQNKKVIVADNSKNYF